MSSRSERPEIATVGELMDALEMLPKGAFLGINGQEYHIRELELEQFREGVEVVDIRVDLGFPSACHDAIDRADGRRA